MTSPAAASGPPRPRALTFHGPLGEPRAAELTARLAAHRPATVLDIGCGWGELLLRVLAAVPGATGTGLDLDEEDLARGRALAAERGLAGRVEFLAESATGTRRGPADLVLCLGASQALTGAAPPRLVPEALRELRRLVRPGGRALLGEGFWERPPSPASWPGCGRTPRRATTRASRSWWTRRSPPGSARPGSRRRRPPSGRSSSRGTARTWRCGSPPTPATRRPPRPASGPTGSAPPGSPATGTSSASPI
ncbi:SAM-dependent methyltransferase [Actinomadura keratinilytica]